MATISDDGQGIMRPIMRNGDLLFCQQPDGEYTICEKGVGIIETLGYEDPSEEFYNQLSEQGFEKD